MSKYLFLLDELPPTQSANGICAEKVMSCLNKTEDVFCISWDACEKVKNKPFHCITILKKPWTRIVLALQGKQGLFCRLLFLFARVLYWMKRMLLLPVWPIDSVSCVFRFFCSARRLIKENGITHVVAISYPGETLLAMCMLKWQFGKKIKTIMYPLDVTLEGMDHGRVFEKKLSRILGRRFMRFCARQADQLLVLENALYLFEEVFPEQERQHFSCCGIPLLEHTDWNQYVSDSVSKKKEIHFVFGGNLLYSMRNPTALLDLVDKAAWPEEKRVYFDLYGKADSQLQEEWQGRYKRLQIIEHGWVDETTLNAALMSADVLVSIGNTDRHLIPSKLFKYMTTGKRIVHFCFTQHDPCLPYLQMYENYLLMDAMHLDGEKIVHFSTSPERSRRNATALFPTCIPQYTAELIKK